MDDSANVVVHESAFPHEMHRQLVEGLRNRRLNQKFLYLGLKQASRWLALHEAHSPARKDPATMRAYEEAFMAAGQAARGSILHLVGLAAGGGQKEIRCLEVLRATGKTVFFTPCDASVDMALVAHEESTGRLRGLQCTPVICDLPHCGTLPALLKDVDPGGTERIVSFFGAIHNYEPGEILPRLINAVRSQDLFLFSANLVPGQNYQEEVERILPQYRNSLTEAWLGGFLDDLGITPGDGTIIFEMGESEGMPELRRVEAKFHFRESRDIRVLRETVAFRAGEKLRLFFSCRYTPKLVRDLAARHGLAIIGEWLSPDSEEGIFLCKRAAGHG